VDKGESSRSKQILYAVLFDVSSDLDYLGVTGLAFPIGQNVIQAAFGASVYSQIIGFLWHVIFTVSHAIGFVSS
jgi:hypothetical protein